MARKAFLEKYAKIKADVVLDNDVVIDKMTGGNTYVIGGTSNKDGQLVLRSKDLLKTEEEFCEMKETVFANIEKASVNISKGEYPIAPYVDFKADKRQLINRQFTVV